SRWPMARTRTSSSGPDVTGLGPMTAPGASARPDGVDTNQERPGPGGCWSTRGGEVVGGDGSAAGWPLRSTPTLSAVNCGGGESDKDGISGDRTPLGRVTLSEGVSPPMSVSGRMLFLGGPVGAGVNCDV